MNQYYPLQPVVTSNQLFAQTYDNDPQSITLTSGCVTPTEMLELISQGVKFDTVIFLNGEGEDLLHHQLSQGSTPSYPCNLQRVTTPETPSAVQKIHALLNGNPTFFDMG